MRERQKKWSHQKGCRSRLQLHSAGTPGLAQTLTQMVCLHFLHLFNFPSLHLAVVRKAGSPRGSSRLRAQGSAPLSSPHSNHHRLCPMLLASRRRSFMGPSPRRSPPRDRKAVVFSRLAPVLPRSCHCFIRFLDGLPWSGPRADARKEGLGPSEDLKERGGR